MLKQFEITDIRVYLENTGFCVGETDEGEVVAGVTIFPFMGKITAQGDYVTHPKYGKQFKATKIIFNDTISIIGSLLASGFLTGIKKHKAKMMVEYLGDRCWEVLDNCLERPTETMEWNGQVLFPEQILLKVKGVGQHVAGQILDAWEARRHTIGPAVMGIRCGMSGKQFHAAYQYWGVEFERIILEQPYDLTELREFDWYAADLIASLEFDGKEPIHPMDPSRILAGLRHTLLSQKRNGHMCLPVSVALRDASQLLKIDEQDIWTLASGILKNGKMVAYKSEVHGQDMLAMEDLLDMEFQAAEHLDSLIKADTGLPDFSKITAEDIQSFASFQLDDTQLDAVYMMLNNNLSITSGGPGTGKTTVLTVFLNILDEYKIKYLLGSYIGKVAQRMQEATGRPAGTLHRLFEIYKDEEEWMPLGKEYSYLVIDEMSTIAMEIFWPVISLVDEGQRICFIGDRFQLPPIGGGDPFAEMIKSEKIPSTFLSHIHRQDENSGIIPAAHDILAGKLPKGNKNDVFVVTNVREEMVKRAISGVFYLHNERGIPFENIQILSPLNALKDQVNKEAQQAFNPNNEPIKPWGIALHDRVIHTKNNMELQVFNGEQGKVIEVFTDEVTVNQNSYNDEELEKPVLSVLFDGNDYTTGYKVKDMSELMLSYGITGHKSIGSEYAATIVLLPYTRREFMTRQLVYTMGTRAKQIVIFIQEPRSFQKYLGNSTVEKRYTLLYEFLG